jgi:hypothetical protein
LTKELTNPCTHCTKSQNPFTSNRKHRQLRKQYKEVDDDVINLISPTCTVPDIEGVNGMDILTNSPKESGNGDVVARLANIVSEDKGEFRVIKNQLGFTIENASKIMSIPSTFVIHGLPTSRSQNVNLQFGHLFNYELVL